MSSSDIPNSNDARTRLLEAATAIFLEEGYRASVERIAARAGVARQTLYNYFPRKDDLFCEVIRQGTAAMLVALDADHEPLRARLLRFALAFRDCVLGPEGIAFFRTIAAEAPRFPEMTAAFYTNGPEQTTRRLAAVLDKAMAAGELRRDDPVFAARMLLAMLAESERTQRLFSGEITPPHDEAEVERILDLFLRAYAPTPT
jgi:TetR/AcrR family transcriptional repressor of mexJK operon